MKHFVIICSLLFFSVFSLPINDQPVHAAYPGFQEPAYAKWGRLAVFETGKRYPDYQIVDYLYMGRSMSQNGEHVERFKLWLKKGNMEKGVVITITITPGGNLKGIHFQETTRKKQFL